jgi:hypothetical protein
MDQFYGRLLTRVHGSHQEDDDEVARTVAEPDRFNESKLWPNSEWYIRRWDWEDWKGIIISVVSIIGIGGLMLFLANLGR